MTPQQKTAQILRATPNIGLWTTWTVLDNPNTVHIECWWSKRHHIEHVLREAGATVYAGVRIASPDHRRTYSFPVEWPKP